MLTRSPTLKWCETQPTASDFRLQAALDFLSAEFRLGDTPGVRSWSVLPPRGVILPISDLATKALAPPICCMNSFFLFKFLGVSSPPPVGDFEAFAASFGAETLIWPPSARWSLSTGSISRQPCRSSTNSWAMCPPKAIFVPRFTVRFFAFSAMSMASTVLSAMSALRLTLALMALRTHSTSSGVRSSDSARSPGWGSMAWVFSRALPSKTGRLGIVIFLWRPSFSNCLRTRHSVTSVSGPAAQIVVCVGTRSTVARAPK